MRITNKAKFVFKNVNEYKIAISILVIFIGLWILGFQILYIYTNTVINTIYETNSKTLLKHITDVEKGLFISVPLLNMIIEYDKNNFENKEIIYSLEKNNLKIINNYKRSFAYDHPYKKNKKVMFIYNEISPVFYVLTFFSSIIGIIMFFILIIFFYSLQVKRNTIYDKAYNAVEKEDLTNLRRIFYLNREVTNIINKIVEIFEKKNQSIKECNEYAKQLENEILQLRNTDVLKTSIMENISHELKSPLTKVKGYLDFIYDEKMGNLSPNQKSGLLIAKRNVDLLLKQINQILQYAKEDALVVENRLLSLNRLIKELALIYSKQCEKKNIELFVNIKNLTSPIYGDRIALYEVFDNLLSNALKFTEKNGKINIIGYEREIENMKYSIIKIEDTGIGIPHDKIEKLFDRFYQIEYKSNRKYPGMGLGLTIVKNIIDRHNGKIKVSSVLGKGSVFTVCLPITNKGGINE